MSLYIKNGLQDIAKSLDKIANAATIAAEAYAKSVESRTPTYTVSTEDGMLTPSDIKDWPQKD